MFRIDELGGSAIPAQLIRTSSRPNVLMHFSMRAVAMRSSSADRRDGLLHGNGVAPVDHHTGAEAAEQFGDCASDTTAAANHHRTAPGKQFLAAHRHQLSYRAPGHTHASISSSQCPVVPCNSSKVRGPIAELCSSAKEKIRTGLTLSDRLMWLIRDELLDDVAGKEHGAMRTSVIAIAAVALATTLAGVSAASCSSNSKSSTATSKSATSTASTQSPASTSAPAQPTDYTRLLIQATDLNAPETFTASPPVKNPNGQAGVATTFSNEDRSHVITDTIQILSDPAAATSALNARKTRLDGVVHGSPEPINVGTGGTTISGPSPDRSKGVTVLLFTEGRAFAELEFDGPADSLVPPDFVNDTGQKQDTAIKKGLTG